MVACRFQATSRSLSSDADRRRSPSRARSRARRRAAASPVAARADAVDDTLAKFLDDKFPQTERRSANWPPRRPPQAAAILEALGDNRLMIDPADHIVAYKTAAGALLNAKTGEPIPASSAAAFKKVRVNNALRSAIQGAMGSLTLANPDPEKRLAAAEDVFKTHDAKALPALQDAARQGKRPARRRGFEARAGLDLRHQRQRFDRKTVSRRSQR